MTDGTPRATVWVDGTPEEADSVSRRGSSELRLHFERDMIDCGLVSAAFEESLAVTIGGETLDCPVVGRGVASNAHGCITVEVPADD